MKHYRWEDMPLEALSSTIGRRMISGEEITVENSGLSKRDWSVFAAALGLST